MRKTLLLLAVGLAGVAAGALGATTYVGAQGAAQVTRTELLRQPISGIEGKEVIVFVADVPPGAIAARHAHPGDEAIYMLQGALTFAPDGGQPFELKAGQITFNPAKQVHMAKNVSSSEPAKVLNCMLAEKNQPLTLPAN
jgi:quercetin dioxygenase-like cupin family protein